MRKLVLMQKTKHKTKELKYNRFLRIKLIPINVRIYVLLPTNIPMYSGVLKPRNYL